MSEDSAPHVLTFARPLAPAATRPAITPHHRPSRHCPRASGTCIVGGENPKLLLPAVSGYCMLNARPSATAGLVLHVLIPWGTDPPAMCLEHGPPRSGILQGPMVVEPEILVILPSFVLSSQCSDFEDSILIQCIE